MVAGEFKPLGQLVLSAVLENGEAAPCAGYCTASPARKYYAAGADVTVSAHVGSYEFVHGRARTRRAGTTRTTLGRGRGKAIRDITETDLHVRFQSPSRKSR